MKVLCVRIPFSQKWLVLPTFKILTGEEVEVVRFVGEAISEGSKRRRYE